MFSKISSFADLKKCVAQMVDTLPSEGYTLMWQHADPSEWLILLRYRHKRNGNFITIRADKTKVQQWKNKKLTRTIPISVSDA